MTRRPTETAGAGAGPSPVARAVGTAAAVLLGAVLLFSAWAKALDPNAFVEQIRGEGLDFLLPAAAVAAIALALEIGLGGALLLAIRRRWVLISTSLLVLFFLFLTGRTYWRSLNGTLEETAGCGCFGNLVERTPAEAFWQDLVLLGVPLLLAFVGRRRGGPVPWARLAVVGALVVGGLVFSALSPSLPIDDLATRLDVGTELASICAGADEERLCLTTAVPELAEGERLAILADLEDEAFAEAVGRINTALADGQPIVVLSSAEPEAVQKFFWTAGPAFEIREAPLSLLKPLYRTLPRSFRAVDGVVTETFAGLPPLPEERAPELPFSLGDGGGTETPASP